MIFRETLISLTRHSPFFMPSVKRKAISEWDVFHKRILHIHSLFNRLQNSCMHNAVFINRYCGISFYLVSSRNSSIRCAHVSRQLVQNASSHRSISAIAATSSTLDTVVAFRSSRYFGTKASFSS